MNGFEPDAWREYFVATAGIGAALAGLVFVAFSINLRDILKYPGVVGRGAEALFLLLSIAVVAIVGLWPVPSGTVGVALVVVGVPIWLAVTAIVVRSGRGRQATGIQTSLRVLLGQLGTLPTIVAGISLVLATGPGLDILPFGALASLAGGVIGAWVLLVEILR